MFKKFPFHTFLLPVFFILHVVNEYYLLIPSHTVFRFAGYYILLSAILLLSGKLIYKSNLKAGIWATTLLIVFFFFGALYDFFISLFHSSVITSYKIILPCILTAGIIFSTYLKKTRRSFAITSQFLTVLFCLFIAIETIQLLYKTMSNEEEKADFGYNSGAQFKEILPGKGTSKPDIFFIVFDEYASSPSLEKMFSFTNSAMDSVFKSNNFYIAQNSKSNYSSTPLSIGSTFNLDYFQRPMPDSLSGKFYLQSWYTLKMNKLATLLTRQGYKIFNYGLCDFKECPAHTTRYITGLEARLLYEETLWGRMKKVIFWNLARLHLPFMDRYFEKKLHQEKKNYIERNENNLQSLLSQLKTQESEPKFVFGHIMMPHSPFYFDRHGNLNPDSIRINQKLNKKLYLEQLIYTNKLITPLVIATNQTFNRPRVVIIEGDHGLRQKNPPVPIENHFMNLNTYFFSDKDYTLLYDSISPVNTFRVVLNKYFNTNLPLLKDSSIFIKY